MSESYVRLNPMRMFFHIENDKKWQKVTAGSLFKTGKDQLEDANNFSRNEEDGPEEFTVQRIMQQLEKSGEKKALKDKGLGRVHFLARDKDDQL